MSRGEEKGSPRDGLSAEQGRVADVGLSEIVSAGAGSGKTRVLVARYLRLLRKGVKPRGIVAMTFSRKAAAELRHRIDEALAGAVHDRTLEGGPISDDERAALFEARSRLADGHIGTIHSFCKTLLAEEPSLMPDRPGFTVLNATRVNQLKRLALHRAAWASDPLTSPLTKLRSAGLTHRAIEKMTLELLGKGWELDEARVNHQTDGDTISELLQQELGIFRKTVIQVIPSGINERFDNLFSDEQCLAILRSHKAHPDFADSCEVLRTVQRQIHELQEGSTETREALNDLLWFRDVKAPTKGKGLTKVKTPWNPFTHLRDSLADSLPGNPISLDTEMQANALTGILFRWLDEVGSEYRRLKVEALGADYNDLLDRVAEGLVADESLVDGLRRRYRHFLVDEFQDTDPRQWDIIRALAFPDEEERRNGGRTLFIVGDRKQAIYGFRGGDNTVFAKAGLELESILADGGSKSLGDNYRSREAVLNFVNPLFGKIFGDDARLIDEAPESSTAVGPQHMNPRRGDGEGGSVTLVDTSSVDKPGKSGGVAVEGLKAAWVVKRALEGDIDGIPGIDAYPDEEVGAGSRPMIGVFTRTHKQLLTLAAALDYVGLRGRYSVAWGGRLFDTEEAGWLRAVLGALTDSRDEIALTATLLSPFGGFSFDDLLRIKREADRERVTWMDVVLKTRLDGEDPKWGAFRERWRRWKRQAAVGSASRLVASIYSASGLEAALEAENLDDRWQRLNHLLELIRDQEKAGALKSPAETVAWFEDNREAKDFVQPTPEYAPVVLMTMHGAKGLEFPVVALPFLTRKTGGYGTDYDLARASDGRWMLALKTRSTKPPYDRVRTILGQSLHLAREEKNVLEEKRLFYVSCTRARDHLLLIYPHDPERKLDSLTGRMADKKPGRWLDTLIETSGDAVTLDGHPVGRLLEMPELPEKAPGLEPDGWGVVESLDLVGPLRVGDPPRVSPSVLGELERCPIEFYLKRMLKMEAGAPAGSIKPDDARETDEERVRGTDFGSALHYLVAAKKGRPMGKAEITALLNREAAYQNFPDETVRGLSRHLDRLTGMETWREALAGNPVFELPFRVELHGCLLMGYVDALVETPRGFRVFDFKTNRLDGATPVERIEEHGYDLQLGAYALALEKRYDKRVTGAVLLFTADGGGAVEVELDKSRERVVDLLHRAASLAVRPFAQVITGPHGENCPGCEFDAICQGLR